jgi:hypothetical protein
MGRGQRLRNSKRDFFRKDKARSSVEMHEDTRKFSYQVQLVNMSTEDKLLSPELNEKKPLDDFIYHTSGSFYSSTNALIKIELIETVSDKTTPMRRIIKTIELPRDRPMHQTLDGLLRAAAKLNRKPLKRTIQTRVLPNGEFLLQAVEWIADIDMRGEPADIKSSLLLEETFNVDTPIARLVSALILAHQLVDKYEQRRQVESEPDVIAPE